MNHINPKLMKTTLDNAKGIAWDTCHKIYILMDDEQMALMEQYEYDPMFSSKEMTPQQMFETLSIWFNESCGLRFIEAVKTLPNGESEFTTIIGQFEDELDPDEDIQDSEEE